MTIIPSTQNESFAEAAAGMLPSLVQLRRALHSSPELGLDLPKTQAKVLDALADLDLDITLGSGSTSVTAVLRGAREGNAVLLRGDMDGLPVTEETDLDYASTNGNMHACGHDLHTAALVGAARLLHERRGELAGEVIFMFQPGEEGPGGAEVMLNEGILTLASKKVTGAYGIHVIPGTRGIFTSRPGTIMAGSNVLRITVNGRGGHGSAPSQAVDPVPVLAEMVLALQTFITRRFSASDPVVLSVTQLSAGDAVNVIPESASLSATVRTLSTASFQRVQSEAPRLAAGIADAHGCTSEVSFEVLYPVTVNDNQATVSAMRVLADTFGSQRVEELEEPMMGSEDFSLVLDRVPGTFVFLMASPPELDSEKAEYNHSPRVLFDDSVLSDQAAALAALAWAHLRNSDQ